MELAATFKRAAAKGCQILAAVHHPFLIWAFPEVYSVEHRKWLTSREFVDSQLDNSEKCAIVNTGGGD